jgi:hypothetical protein
MDDHPFCNLQPDAAYSPYIAFGGFPALLPGRFPTYRFPAMPISRHAAFRHAACNGVSGYSYSIQKFPWL